ncbi:MAG: hypothetical protein Q7K11_00340 [Candidatus Berkelbacteria bacterium]|nr:hypothetical protein [Candidatus Berkelbacteria bacterium]
MKKSTLIVCLVLMAILVITVPVFAMGKPVVRSVPDGSVQLVPWDVSTNQPYLTETPEGLGSPSLDYLPKDAAIMANFLPAWGKGELDYVELRKNGLKLWKRNKPPFNQLIEISSDMIGIYHGIEYVIVVKDKTNNSVGEKYRIVDQMIEVRPETAVNSAPTPVVEQPSTFLPYTGNKVVQLGQVVTIWVNKVQVGTTNIVRIDRDGFCVTPTVPAGAFFRIVGDK